MGVHSTSTGGERFNADEQTIAEVFRQAGYQPKVAARLDAALKQFIKQTNPRSSRDKESRPITLGHADDKITWNVDVLEDGDFEVEKYYACQADSAGSTIELTLGGDRIEATVDVAHDVPLKGMEHDRFERVEGYIKDWRPMKLGVIHLRRGRATLTLRATGVPGKQVAEMRLLMFRRIETAL